MVILSFGAFLFLNEGGGLQHIPTCILGFVFCVSIGFDVRLNTVPLRSFSGWSMGGFLYTYPTRHLRWRDDASPSGRHGIQRRIYIRPERRSGQGEGLSMQVLLLGVSSHVVGLLQYDSGRSR